PWIATCQSNTTSGPCSPITANNSGSITINCQGIPSKLGNQLVELLNRVAKNQIDAEALMAKLDGCLQGVQDMREQQADWRLSEYQIRQMKRVLAGAKAKASFHLIPTERNAALIAGDIASALAPEWSLLPGGPDFRMNPALVGVRLVISHPNFPEAVMLQKA